MKKLITIGFFLFLQFIYSQIGISTTDPKTTLDVNGALALREGDALTLVNGANNNVNLGTTAYSVYRISGPTASFSISGIVPLTSANGQIVVLENTTAQDFTITHDATSTAANRIFCPGSKNLILSGQFSTVSLIYNTTQSRWIVIGCTDNPYGRNIQSVVGLTDTTINSSTFADMAGMTITFTPKHSVVFVNFGASGDINISSDAWQQGFVEFKLFKDATAVAGTVSLGTDYDFDDFFGDNNAAAWNAHFTMYPVSVTPGVATTIKIQWMRDGISMGGAARCRPTTNPDFSHRNLTIFD